MSKKLFVGSLPYSVTEDQLRDMFAPMGELQSVKIITDKFTGQSRGFGFVEMPNDEEADKAIADLNGKEMDGRTIVVNEARPQQPRSRGGFGGGPGDFGGGRSDRGGFRSDRGGGGGGGGGGRRRERGGGGGGGNRW